MTIKKIFFVFLSALMAYLSVKQVKQIVSITDSDLNWWISSIFAVLLCLYVTGTFAFVGFQFPTHKIISSRYYKIKNPALVLSVHNFFGVKYFNIFLMAFIWGKPKNREIFFDGTRSGIKNLMYQTKQSEFGHLGPLIILLGFFIWFGFLGHYKIVFIIIILNTIGNLYPILLQRKHRIRIERLMKIIKFKTKKKLPH